MLTDIMDFDPRITSDGNGDGAAHGVHCNFHYGSVHDVFDEDTKNEAACVQALRHLIAKADSEIDDLEDELAVLQCQQKWGESDEHANLFEVCCADFKGRIDSLTSTIQRLRNGVDTVSETQRPAEKICDIIDALIKSNITELDEQSQEGDLNSEKEQVVSCGSLNIDTDTREQATTLELSMESDKQTPVPEKLDEPTQTVSEESISDTAKYTTTDLTEVISMGLTDVKISEQIENAEHASKEKSGFSTSIEPVTSRSPFQASNDEGNTKPTGPQCGEIESCMDGSKTGESMSPVLVAKTGVIVKVEHDDHDTNIQHDSAVEEHLLALENQSQSVSDLEITYGRKNSRLSLILKPPGKKVRKKIFDDVRTVTPSQTLMPQKTITKRKYSSSIKNLGHSEIDKSCRFLPETSCQRKLETEENSDIGIPLQVSQDKKRKPKGAKVDFPDILSSEVNVPEGSVDAKVNVAPNSSGRITLHLKSPKPVEVKETVVTSFADTLTLGSNAPIVENTKTEMPEFDLKSLKERRSEPNFLKNLKVRQLREIGKLFNLRGASKFTKEKLIEGLSKCLATL